MTAQRRWWEFRATHDEPCRYGKGHAITLGTMAHSLVEAQRDITLRWPAHTINLTPLKPEGET